MTVMVAQERTLVLDRRCDLRCDLGLLRTPTSFLASTLALVLALAVTHAERGPSNEVNKFLGSLFGCKLPVRGAVGLIWRANFKKLICFYTKSHFFIRYVPCRSYP